MNIDITQIVVAVIGLLGLVVTSVLVPLIRTKISAEQWDTIYNYAVAAGQGGGTINLRRPGGGKVREGEK